jgi:hypothetical protein
VTSSFTGQRLRVVDDMGFQHKRRTVERTNKELLRYKKNRVTTRIVTSTNGVTPQTEGAACHAEQSLSPDVCFNDDQNHVKEFLPKHNIQKPTVQGLHEYNLDLRNQDHNDSLLNCMLSTQKKMDKRHLEVFARAKNSRIVLLSYHIDTDRFTGIDMDWRNVPPKIGTFIKIPNFGKDYDFYRTAIVTYS